MVSDLDLDLGDLLVDLDVHGGAGITIHIVTGDETLLYYSQDLILVCC